MPYEGYTCLKIRVDRGVVFATVDHPPINILDLELMQELDRIGTEVEADDSVRVIIFDSADPDFFIAHADVTLLQGLSDEVPPKPTTPSACHLMVDRFRTMPKASIAKVEGRARGGGSEFALSLDMRFAALGKASFAQPEVAIGIIPGGSGTQRLPRVMGRARALEVILGCDDIPADRAERYGYINRALPPEELTPFVERLAYRIASFPAEAIALAKASVNAAELPIIEGLTEESHYFNQSLALQAAKERMARFIALGGQTREVELNMEDLPDKLAGK